MKATHNVADSTPGPSDGLTAHRETGRVAVFGRHHPGNAAPTLDRQTYTVEEAAGILGISRNRAYESVRTGEIPVIHLGRRLLVPKKALERLLAAEPSTADNPSGTSKL